MIHDIEYTEMNIGKVWITIILISFIVHVNVWHYNFLMFYNIFIVM